MPYRDIENEQDCVVMERDIAMSHSYFLMWSMTTIVSTQNIILKSSCTNKVTYYTLHIYDIYQAIDFELKIGKEKEKYNLFGVQWVEMATKRHLLTLSLDWDAQAFRNKLKCVFKWCRKLDWQSYTYIQTRNRKCCQIIYG